MCCVCVERCITVLTGNRMGWTVRFGRSPLLLPSCRKLEFRLSALMDSDLARVNGKSGRQSWRYADAFQRCIISEAIFYCTFIRYHIVWCCDAGFWRLRAASSEVFAVLSLACLTDAVTRLHLWPVRTACCRSTDYSCLQLALSRRHRLLWTAVTWRHSMTSHLPRCLRHCHCHTCLLTAWSADGLVLCVTCDIDSSTTALSVLDWCTSSSSWPLSWAAVFIAMKQA